MPLERGRAGLQTQSGFVAQVHDHSAALPVGVKLREKGLRMARELGTFFASFLKNKGGLAGGFPPCAFLGGGFDFLPG